MASSLEKLLFVFNMIVCSLLPCGHLLGKGWPLGSRLWYLTVFLSLLGQVWYLIVSILDLCRLSYFNMIIIHKSERYQDHKIEVYWKIFCLYRSQPFSLLVVFHFFCIILSLKIGFVLMDSTDILWQHSVASLWTFSYSIEKLII